MDKEIFFKLSDRDGNSEYFHVINSFLDPSTTAVNLVCVSAITNSSIVFMYEDYPCYKISHWSFLRKELLDKDTYMNETLNLAKMIVADFKSRGDTFQLTPRQASALRFLRGVYGDIL